MNTQPLDHEPPSITSGLGSKINPDFMIICTIFRYGSGSVGRAVTSDSRGLPFESSHWQNLIMNVLTVEMTKINEKEAGYGPFKKH